MVKAHHVEDFMITMSQDLRMRASCLIALIASGHRANQSQPVTERRRWKKVIERTLMIVSEYAGELFTNQQPLNLWKYVFNTFSPGRLTAESYLAPRSLHHVWYCSHAGGFEQAQSIDENLMKWLSEQDIFPNEEPRFGFRIHLKTGNVKVIHMCVVNVYQ